MSAASVSRTGLPFSQLSATARMSLFFSIASAIALSPPARSEADASPQASFAAWAASNASSTSSGVESATSVIGPAVAGAKFTRYFPCVGASHFPPMKFSYLGWTETMLPGKPGGTYFMSSLPSGNSDDRQCKPPVRGCQLKYLHLTKRRALVPQQGRRSYRMIYIRWGVHAGLFGWGTGNVEWIRVPDE